MLAKHVLSYQREARNGEERNDIIGLLLGSGSPAVLCAATMPVWFFTLMRLYGCRGFMRKGFQTEMGDGKIREMHARYYTLHLTSNHANIVGAVTVIDMQRPGD